MVRQNHVLACPALVDHKFQGFFKEGSASIKRVSNFTKRDGVDEKKSTGCKEDYWPLYRRSFYEQEDSLIGAKRVSCGVRRRESEDEICGADLILESASVSSSS
ncbi:hypothetical protein Bca4012_052055 [Brassica carinata]